MAIISIVMPAYNTEDFIAEAIKSVQRQSFLDWELIIINDGSPDNLVEVVNQYTSKDVRIRLYSQENSGVAVARNYGMELAQGHYIVFLDSDDYWLDGFLQKIYEAFEETKCDIVYVGYLKEKKDKSVKKMGLPFYQSKVFLNRVEKKQPILLPTAVFRLKYLQERQLNFQAGKMYGEDIEFLLKAMMQAKICVIEEFLYFYRFRQGSAMRSQWSYKQVDALICLENVYKYAKEQYTEDDKEIVLDALQRELVLLFYRTVMGAAQSGEWKAVEDLIIKYPQYVQKSESLPFDKRLRLHLLALNQVWSNTMLKLYFKMKK